MIIIFMLLFNNNLKELTNDYFKFNKNIENSYKVINKEYYRIDIINRYYCFKFIYYLLFLIFYILSFKIINFKNLMNKNIFLFIDIFWMLLKFIIVLLLSENDFWFKLFYLGLILFVEILFFTFILYNKPVYLFFIIIEIIGSLLDLIDMYY